MDDSATASMAGQTVQPAVFEYNDAGLLIALTTWRDGGQVISTDPLGMTGGDTTLWAYNDATGLELRKTFADGRGSNRTYDAANRFYTSTDARNITTIYTYDMKPEKEYIIVNYSHTRKMEFFRDEYMQMLKGYGFPMPCVEMQIERGTIHFAWGYGKAKNLCEWTFGNHLIRCLFVGEMMPLRTRLENKYRYVHGLNVPL